jgi:hypothetical protein
VAIRFGTNTHNLLDAEKRGGDQEMTKQHNLNTFNNNTKSKLNLSKVTNLFIISQSKLFMSTT